MKNKYKNLLYIAITLVIILIIAFLFLSGDKSLDVSSLEITTLYSYLGEEDISHCGGLNVYKEEAVTLDNISLENTLCMAYYNISDLKTEDTNTTGVNKDGTKTCRVGKNTTFIALENEDTCSYSTITKEDLNNAYQKIYGENIKEYSNFYVTPTKTCELEGDKYYCGDTPNNSYSLGMDAEIYRLIDKAIEQPSAKNIIIYDYFLRISDNKCYPTNSNDNENVECTEALSDNIDEEFMKKYGTIYKHTYKKQGDNYYWYKSEIKP